MTYTLFFRRSTLQYAQMGLTDALTFTTRSVKNSLTPQNPPTVPPTDRTAADRTARHRYGSSLIAKTPRRPLDRVHLKAHRNGTMDGVIRRTDLRSKYRRKRAPTALSSGYDRGTTRRSLRAAYRTDSKKISQYVGEHFVAIRQENKAVSPLERTWGAPPVNAASALGAERRKLILLYS